MMIVEKILNMLELVNGETVVFIRAEEMRVLACGNWYQDKVLEYAEHEAESFTWQDDNKLYIDVKQNDIENAEARCTKMKPYRVRFWHRDEDGREDFMEFDTLEQAQEFYGSLDGMAEIQEWNEKWKHWWAVQGPEFEI